MSQSDKFYEEYTRIKDSQQYSLIPPQHIYEQIIDYLLNNIADESINKNTLRNWSNRYANSIKNR